MAVLMKGSVRKYFRAVIDLSPAVCWLFVAVLRWSRASADVFPNGSVYLNSSLNVEVENRTFSRVRYSLSNVSVKSP